MYTHKTRDRIPYTVVPDWLHAQQHRRKERESTLRDARHVTSNEIIHFYWRCWIRRLELYNPLARLEYLYI